MNPTKRTDRLLAKLAPYTSAGIVRRANLRVHEDTEGPGCHAARLRQALEDYRHNLRMAAAEDKAYMNTDHGDHGLAAIAKAYGVTAESILEAHEADLQGP